MEQLSKDRLIVRLDEVDSTNSYMKQLLQENELEEGSMIIAEYQTGGRGQKGNSWFSGKAENLLFSMLLLPTEVKASEQFIISRIISLAIKNTLDHFTNDIRIKWPNDIYWKDKKIAGILIENDLQDNSILHSIVGVGLNVNQQIFPMELPNPVSLRQITGATHDRNYILETIMREFFLLYRELQKGNISEIEDEYMLDLYRINDYFWFEDSKGQFQAKIHRVLPSGHLVLKTLNDDEERTYAFKEIQFINK